MSMGSDCVSEMLPRTGLLFIPQVHKYGAIVEEHWQDKTKELGEKPISVLLCPRKTLHKVVRALTQSSAVEDRQLTL
jgi:hypothetical protein